MPTKEEKDKATRQWLNDRERGRTDLFWLANVVLSPADSRIMEPHAHGCIVDHCQKFSGREEYADPVKLSKYGAPLIVASQPRVPMSKLPGNRDNLILVARGHLKTTIHTIAHCIQWIINYPDVRILIATSTDEKAQMIVREMKAHFQFNAFFRFLYPEFCPDGRKVSDWGSSTEFTVPNRVRKAKEPTVMTAAVGKALASTHHDVIKASDVVTENNIGTQGQISSVKGWFGFLNPTRERYKSPDGKSTRGWLDIEGTIYDFSDHHNDLLDRTKRGELPWYKVLHQSCWIDKAANKPLWPERFPVDELERTMEDIGPVLFASQYELNPISPSSGLATQDQVKFFPAHLVPELMPRYRVYTTVDLAGMDPQTEGDSTVFSTCGFDTDGRCDVLSIVKGRFTLDKVVNLFFAIQDVYPANLAFKVQKDHFSRTIWPILQREQSKRGKWLNITLTPISNRVSKQQRIRGLQAWFLQGIIRFADNISCRNDLLLEILRFPKYEHDDILDTLADQMHNRDGEPSSGVYPDAPKGNPLGAVPNDKFLGFDPIGQERWLHDAIESATPYYDAMTGAL